MALFSGTGFVAKLTVGNEHLVARIQDIGVRSFAAEIGILGVVVDGAPVGDSKSPGDAAQTLSLSDYVIGWHFVWLQLTLIDIRKTSRRLCVDTPKREILTLVTVISEV